MAEILETLMIVSFGISWPLSIVRSYRSRSTKGKSLLFMCFIAFGYVCGIASKCMTQTFNLAFWFYFPNIIMVSTDIVLYFRNRAIEKKAEAAVSTGNGKAM
jgi:bacteriorhodopsin